MMNARRRCNLLFALLGAVMLGLAAGALWMLPIVYLQQRLSWLALPIGWLLALGIRCWVQPPGRAAGVLAAIATLLATGYAGILTAAVRIAGILGIGLTDAMRTAGLGMLLSVSHFSASPSSIACTLLGTVIAVWIAGRTSVTRRGAPIDQAP